VTLKNKRILITAGPTWVPIDKVRVISNIATGKTGILLAKEAKRRGAKVKLVVGPVGTIRLSSSIRIKHFCYFKELHRIIKNELDTKKYDIVIHSAAVSDYQPRKSFSGKIKSKNRNLFIDLESTVKIVDKIKKYAPETFLVLFKLELNMNKEKLIKEARKTMRDSNADLAVANTFSKGSYRAFIVDDNKLLGTSSSKQILVKNLLKTISSQLN